MRDGYDLRPGGCQTRTPAAKPKQLVVYLRAGPKLHTRARPSARERKVYS